MLPAYISAKNLRERIRCDTVAASISIYQKYPLNFFFRFSARVTMHKLSQQFLNKDCDLGVRNNKQASILLLVVTYASSPGYENKCLQGMIIVV